jgi:hypothetical protein
MSEKEINSKHTLILMVKIRYLPNYVRQRIVQKIDNRVMPYH